ncbi:uncharacterized protein LOC119080626 [Bradysia coprophila]|uniref:uncharacterized protein LOC119080626 n=1 Tax=Bradysia coprophila TaxID=38358 RepID=UPI00187D85DA|nr:uncharacterized protein LOC119080626 [Bradysia coprophila]
MNRLSKWICGWQTVLTGCLLVAPVFVLSADLFQPPKHNSNLIIPTQYPQRYIRFHRQHTNNAKNLETLNSRSVLSSHDDLMHNTMINAEKPVDAIHKMHRIEQLQQKQEPTMYSDQQLDAKNKNAFFDEDDGNNVMRPHGQPGNVLSTQFIDDGNAEMFKRNPPMKFNRYKRNVTKPMSFAEHLISKLSASNAAVNYSQSYSPDLWLPLDIQGTIYDYSVDVNERTRNNNKNIRSIFPQQPHVVILNGPPTRIYGAGTESKFPPFLEFFVQRIQKYFSVYKYEDLSRPVLPSQIPTDEDSVYVADSDDTSNVTETALEET